MYGPYADLAAIQELVNQKLIACRPHPLLSDVFIYNYTARAQYERVWNEHVVQCRGLILDDKGKILARPIPKFFNHDETQVGELPWDMPFEVTTKMDGSLIIYSDGLVASRGSFESQRAKWAAEIFNEMNLTFDPTITYCFELIHPANRIVVDYSGQRKLVLLAMIVTATGNELSLDSTDLKVERTTRHAVADIAHGSELSALETPNAEGFVVRFENGLRVKIKFEEYKRLHRIVTGTSNISVWEALSAGESLDEILEITPDEFNEFIRKTINELQLAYQKIDNQGVALYNEIKALSNRKDQAMHIIAKNSLAAPIAFKLLDNKPYADIIWKLIKPDFKQPFQDRE